MRSPPILENSYGGSREREKENPEIKQHEHLPNKIPHYSRVSQKSNFVANFLDQFRFRKCE